MRTQKRSKRIARKGMVVDDENACSHLFLIGRSASADKRYVKRRRTDFQSWLWGEVVLSVAARQKAEDGRANQQPDE